MSIAPKDRVGRARDGRQAALRRSLARFRREENGSLVIFSLMLLVAMLFTAGLAVDFMRYESTRSQLQNTMDRAVLAAASLNQSQDAEEVVRDYFLKAGLGDYLGPIQIEEDISSGTAAYRKVKAVAGATLDPIFLPIMEKVVRPRKWAVREGHSEDANNLLANQVDFTKMPVFAASTAEEGISDLEISLVVDVSGSMGWGSSSGNSKIYELREAAKDFAYNMQCNPNQDRGSGAACEVQHGKVSISIVPYSEQVAAGPVLLGQYNVTNEHNSSFCVDFTSDDFATTSMQNFVKDPAIITPAPQDILERTGHFDPWNNYNYSPGSWTCRNESWRWIKPFMDDLGEVYSAINALSAGGNTSIDLGMKWGTALLDPGSQQVVTNLTNTPVASGSTEMVIDPVFDGRPYAYDQDYNMKAIILMTDGVNTDQHYLKDTYRSGPSIVWHYKKANGDFGDTEIYSIYNDDYKKYRWVKPNGYYYDYNWHSNPYVGSDGAEAYQMTYQEVWSKFTTKWFDRFAPNPVSEHGNATKNARLADICTAAKEQDILVYTIGFEVGEGSEEEAVMRSCASTYNHFFLADGMNLADTFGAIASSINQLRLTE
ncbi:TadE/TadG family type IV pilus assembly protein [Rhodovulum marinum]|uniref:Putative Flp pilus-assembly TadE/G-like protein n=1 Tax=Rhodovulum marinum TaxID=320662 RepID=A0A4R2Q3B3_9RHOB|nr:Tad domain-containing protein [Rhodovulum marinum]TCP43192.1 putative Flp pilus-assembly TadE/G-like protein [Rhodovulum marinum]